MPAKPSNPEQSRMDRIQQLRAEHQRRHMERSGKFIPDEREENHYESDVRQVCTIIHRQWYFCYTILILFLYYFILFSPSVILKIQ